MEASAKSSEAYELLRAAILTGANAPGEPLRLTALSAQYGISATPLREALSRLEANRFVTATANKGWRVAPVSLEELEDLEAARLSIETSLLADSIHRGDLVWESRVVAAHYRLTNTQVPIGSGSITVRQAWIDAHDAFHQALLEAARSSWLKSFYVQTTDQLQRHHQALLFHPRAINPAGRQTHSPEVVELLATALSLPAHTRLMKVTLARDVSTAIAMLTEHVEITLSVYRTIAKAAAISNRQPTMHKEEESS